MKKVNPFNPGFGVPPPLLAGRDAEQKVLLDSLAELTAKPTGAGIMLYGPRGMGKTVLLGWFEAACGQFARENGRGVSVTRVSAPVLLDSHEAMLDILLPADAVLSEFESGARGGLPGIASVTGKAKLQIRQRAWSKLADNLIAACEKTPTVLLVDEAHAIDKVEARLYRQFLNVAQQVMEKAPLLLVLAGTPGLPDAVAGVKSTFAGRAGEIGVAPLPPDAAAAAMRGPLHDAGYDIDHDALSFAVQDSQCYPYFLQCWGRALWHLAYARETAPGNNGVARLALPDAKKAAAAVDRERTAQYERRYMEVNRHSHMQRAAAAIAEAFAKESAIDSGRLQAIVRAALRPLGETEDPNAMASKTLEQLRHLDYVWTPPGRSTTVPGIPSMMDYTRFKLRQEQAGGAAG